MNNEQATSRRPDLTEFLADDLNRQLTVADADGEELRRVSIVGNNYTNLGVGCSDGRTLIALSI